MKKAKTLLLTCLMLVICLTGCNKNVSTEDSNNFENLTQLLGMEKADIARKIELTNPQQNISEEIYTISHTLNNQPCTIKLVFYNEVCTRFSYEFDNTELAYSHARKVRSDLEAKFGPKTTYPGIVLKERDFFDNITDVSQLQELWTYYEDFTAEASSALEEKAMNGREYSRIDVRMELRILPQNKSSIHVRYIAIPRR